MKTLVGAAEPPERPTTFPINTAGTTTVPGASGFVLINTTATLRAPLVECWAMLNTAAAMWLPWS